MSRTHPTTSSRWASSERAMLAPCAPTPDGRCEARRDDLRPAPRMDENPLSLMRPTGSSVADDAVSDSHSVHHASLPPVNVRSYSGLILVKSRSTRDVQEPMSRSEQAVRSWRTRKMTSAKLVASALDFRRISRGPSGSHVPMSPIHRRAYAVTYNHRLGHS